MARPLARSLLSAHCPPPWSTARLGAARTRLAPPLPSSAPCRHVSYRRFGEPESRPLNALWAYQGSGGRSSSGFRSLPGWLPYALGFGGVWVLIHLETVPETGRLRYMDTSEKFEFAMGDQTYRQVLQEYQGKLLARSHPTTRYVEQVAGRIIAASGLSSDHPETREGRRQLQWEVHVIGDPQTKNAFVLPGGKIFVFSGILPVCANEDGLAAVLGHETAHQILRHTGERMSLMKVLFGVEILLSLFGLDFGISHAITTLCLQLPNSRTSEAEADHVGLNLMAKACFDPAEARRMWERMDNSEKAVGGSASLDFLQTHPAHKQRIAKITEWLPEAERFREERCGFTKRSWEAFDMASRGQSR